MSWPLIAKETWFHPEWEDPVRRWYKWLYEVKKKDEEKKMETEHQKLVNRMVASADGGAGLLHTVTKPTAWKGGRF